MPYFLIRGSCTPSTWARLMKNPGDRRQVVRPAIEAAGGRLESLYVAFGKDDFIAIVEMPDAVGASALGIASAASGAFTSFETTPLLTVEEATEGMRKADSIHYTSSS